MGNSERLTGPALGAGRGPVRGVVAPAKGRLQERVALVTSAATCSPALPSDLHRSCWYQSAFVS